MIASVFLEKDRSAYSYGERRHEGGKERKGREKKRCCHLQDSNLRPRRDCPQTLLRNTDAIGKEKQTTLKTLGSALDHSAKVTCPLTDDILAFCLSIYLWGGEVS